MSPFGIGRRAPSSSGVYSITSLGRIKADKPGLSETKYIILSHLKDAPCSLRELCEETHVREGKMARILHELRADGYVVAASNIER